MSISPTVERALVRPDVRMGRGIDPLQTRSFDLELRTLVRIQGRGLFQKAAR